MSRSIKAKKARMAWRQFCIIYHWRKRRISYLIKTYQNPKDAGRKAREGGISLALSTLRRKITYLYPPHKANPFLRLLNP